MTAFGPSRHAHPILRMSVHRSRPEAGAGRATAARWFARYETVWLYLSNLSRRSPLMRSSSSPLYGSGHLKMTSPTRSLRHGTKLPRGRGADRSIGAAASPSAGGAPKLAAANWKKHSRKVFSPDIVQTNQTDSRRQAVQALAHFGGRSLVGLIVAVCSTFDRKYAVAAKVKR